MTALSPAIAIITPYYNTGAIFEQTRQSLLRQTLQQWEWIVVNDGSTDAAALQALLPLRAGDDARVRVIDGPNRGLPAARNTAVAASSAPLLFFLDSDDLIHPTALEKLAWLMYCDRHTAFATAWNVAFGAQSFRWQHGFEDRLMFLFENTATPLAMVRRSVFEQVGGFDPARRQGLEDYEFWLRCASCGFWGRDIPEFLVCQRRKTPAEYRGYAWPTRDDPRRLRAFQREMRRRYPHVFRQGVPLLPPPNQLEPEPSLQPPPFANPLPEAGQLRALLVLRALDPEAARRASLACAALRRHQLSPTVVVVEACQAELLDRLPEEAEVFVLGHFLPFADYPRFLHYLIDSRWFAAVWADCSMRQHPLLGLLESLRPDVALLDRDTRNADGLLATTPRVGARAARAPGHEARQAVEQLYRAAERPTSGRARSSAWTYAQERLSLWAYPLTLRLRSWRLVMVRSAAWRALGPAWRGLRSVLRRAAGPNGH